VTSAEIERNKRDRFRDQQTGPRELVADKNITNSIKLDRNQVCRDRIVTEPIKILKTCPRLPDKVFVNLMAYVRYVFISKPSFRVIQITQREIVSGSLLLLCALTLILRLRGFGSRGLRLCALRVFRLRGLRLRAIREVLRCEMRVRVRARVILKITNVSLETS
jgi:hypothetical protein